MKLPIKPTYSDELAERKSDHIKLSENARTEISKLDTRFHYEPLFFTHPSHEATWPLTFLGFSFDYPIWVSSMTGGTEHAQVINENLARLCGEFKLGMGLGSCRSLLHDPSRLSDFRVKKFMNSSPLFANIGIAQVEECVGKGSTHRLHEMVSMLEADGLIIHINPLQEWFQPNGDRFRVPPLETLKRFFDQCSYPVIVKEVGQGMGPKSLKALLELPIAGIELAGFGGTNFTLLEKMRGEKNSSREGFVHVGHTCLEMISVLNALPIKNKEIIISGGITSMLDGYELKSKLRANSVIGMASAFLGPALVSYDHLKRFFQNQVETLLTARASLELREEG
jgi:isopentenyl-diphosphate delta-isomerase